jgi:hypothetical protein
MKENDWTKIDITKEEGLPKDDEYVLWRSQNGHVLYDCIEHTKEDLAEERNKSFSVDTDRLYKFLKGNFFTGPFTHFQRVVQPKSNLSSVNKVNMEVIFRNVNEICFTLLYESTGEIRQKRVTKQWLLNRIFQFELKRWKNNGEGILEIGKLSVEDKRTNK